MGGAPQNYLAVIKVYRRQRQMCIRDSFGHHYFDHDAGPNQH